MMNDEIWSHIKVVHANDTRAGIAANTATAGNRSAREAYLSSLTSMEPLVDFADTLPADNEWEPNSRNGNLRQQAQFTIAAFKAGVSITADLTQGGFDSHEENDLEQTINLNELTDGIDYLWEAA